MKGHSGSAAHHSGYFSALWLVLGSSLNHCEEPHTRRRRALIDG